jgi:hypothetical protein
MSKKMNKNINNLKIISTFIKETVLKNKVEV